jgi:hypothetical protein
MLALEGNEAVISITGLIVALVLVGVVVVVLVLLPSPVRRRVLASLGVLVLLLAAWDILNYQTIHVRQRALRSEFTPGMTVSQATSWLEQNKKRLHIASWRYEANGEPTLFIFLDAPFSLAALVREDESAWYLMATVDTETKTLKDLK